MRAFITGGSGFIGTNLMDGLLAQGWEVTNFDPEPASSEQHERYRVAGDIMEREALIAACMEARPDAFIHLAARTDCIEDTTVEEGYQVNVIGTEHVLEAIRRAPTLERALLTSTQFVCGPGRLPTSDDDYFPHTVYGQSKVIAEKMIRAANLPCTWTIVRPVNIWGPYHQRYTREFWRIAARGLYVHPDVPSPIRTYGYIGNVVWQMQRLLELPREQVHGKVVYLGDRPIEIDRWVFGFCKALRGKEPVRVPYWMVKGLAIGGDAISRVIGKPFYITSSRLRSMTQDYHAPMDKTFALVGEPPYTLEQGIEETARWYRNRGAAG